MAAAKAVAGHEAVFWIVPVMGALLVLATYGIGCRLGSPTAGLIGAWLVATSPAVLFVLMAPMTDVPVAAAWAVSFYYLLGQTARSAWLAGVAAALAILIRPNHAPGAAVAAGRYVLAVWRGDAGTRRRATRDGGLFLLGVLPGLVAVALINDRLNGSPLRASYGSLEGMFAVEHFWPNARRYLQVAVCRPAHAREAGPGAGLRLSGANDGRLFDLSESGGARSVEPVIFNETYRGLRSVRPVPMSGPGS